MAHAGRTGVHAIVGVMAHADRPSPEQIARYRAMTPEERLREATRLYWFARRLREAHERALHPDWSEAQVSEHVRRIFLRAGT
jgi:hypothetical protein